MGYLLCDDVADEVMMWLTSLILLLLIDAIPYWLGYNPITSTIINAVFGPGRVEPWAKDVLRGIFFGMMALVILLFKSKRMDKNFRPNSRCAIVTVSVGLGVNTALMAGFIYGHVI